MKNILIPQIVLNGYDSRDYATTQDPDNPNSTFRRYLDLSLNELLLAGIAATNDHRSVRRHLWTGDADLDGDVDLDDVALLAPCMHGPGGGSEKGCLGYDSDDDGDIDLVDVAGFQSTFTDPR